MAPLNKYKQKVNGYDAEFYLSDAEAERRGLGEKDRVKLRKGQATPLDRAKALVPPAPPANGEGVAIVDAAGEGAPPAEGDGSTPPAGEGAPPAEGDGAAAAAKPAGRRGAR